MVITFLYSLAGGMLVVLATARVEQISWRFLRLMGLLIFALTAAATAWSFGEGRFENALLRWWVNGLGVALGVGAAASVFFAPFAATRPGVFRTVCLVSGLTGLCVATLCAIGRTGQIPLQGVALGMVVASQVLGALLLGSITIAWLLGHAYLTATKMTLAPLRHFSRLLLWAVIVRAAFPLFSLGVAWMIGAGGDPSVISHMGQAWLVLVLRVGVGLVGVGVFAYMVADCVRLRATQSATGILYFGSIFAYIGELASQQLITDCGWPL
ncbi:MAG: hypothetical protein IID42_04560 [Planctomycetes bacterium]|nr:hypothetical protein [Planctomycetota bacterium]